MSFRKPNRFTINSSKIDDIFILLQRWNYTCTIIPNPIQIIHSRLRAHNMNLNTICILIGMSLSWYLYVFLTNLLFVFVQYATYSYLECDLVYSQSYKLLSLWLIAFSWLITSFNSSGKSWLLVIFVNHFLSFLDNLNSS